MSIGGVSSWPDKEDSYDGPTPIKYLKIDSNIILNIKKKKGKETVTVSYLQPGNNHPFTN